MGLFEDITSCTVPYDLEKHVREADQRGLFLEFGVSSGATLFQIARNTEQIVYGFDCWEGLPEDLCGISDNKPFVHDPKGSFKADKRPEILPNCRLVDGLFEDSLPPFYEEHHDDAISFLHIDCDLYSSTKTVLEVFKHNFFDGTIICFDEFAEYAPDVWMHHEYKAFEELLEELGPHGFRAECISYTRPRAAFRIGFEL